MSRNTQIRILIIVAVTLICIYGLVRDPDTMGIPFNKTDLVRTGTKISGWALI